MDNKQAINFSEDIARSVRNVGKTLLFFGLFNLIVTSPVCIISGNGNGVYAGIFAIGFSVVEIILGNKFKKNAIENYNDIYKTLSQVITFIYISTFILLIFGVYWGVFTLISLFFLYNARKQVSPKNEEISTGTIKSEAKNMSDGFGEIEKCPYCKKTLDKVPTRKSKCPFCKEIIICRTRPDDRQKILITEKQIKTLEDMWSNYYDEKEKEKLMQDPEFSSIKEALHKRFGQEPSMTDVKWGVFNKRGIEYASKRLWGLYRNNRMDMADLLEKEGKLEQALSTYLEVCYLDLNGPENLTEGLTQRELRLYGEKDFDITSGFLAPGVVYQVSKLIAKLELTKNEVKEKFISENTPDRPLLKMPLSAEKAWQKLEANMKEDEANEKKIETFNVEDSDLLVSEIKKTGKKKNDTLTPIIYKFRNQYRKKEKITSEYNEIKAVIEALLYTNNLDISYQSLGTSLMVFFAKKDKELFSGLILDYIKFIKSNNKVSLSDPILGQLGEINSSWVASFVPEMIEMLQKKSYWNEKRFVGFNLGQIGSKSPELVKEAIPIMVKYIKENKTTQEIFGFDEKSWLKDGYIDALSMIALGDKSLLSEYKSLFEDISKNEGSEYSRKKANAVLQLIS